MRTVIKIFLACLIVGMLLSAMGISPIGLWTWVAQTVKAIIELLASFLGAVGAYVLIGAAVVVPIYLIRQFFRSRRSRPRD